MFFKFPEWRYLRYKIQDRWRWFTTDKLKRFRLPGDKYFWYRVKQKWQGLAIRNWTNRNPKAIMAITAFSVLLCFVLIVNQFVPKKPMQAELPAKAWFYDLNTEELFRAESNLVPPIETPSGPLPNGQPAGVMAHVFYSDDGSEKFIGFLETLTPEAKTQKAASSNSKVRSVKEWYQGRMFRRPDEDKWFPANSPEGRAIFREFFLPREDKAPPQYYVPK